MPTLANPKHEQFARHVSNGMGITDAYVAAGYPRTPSSASQLHAKPEVRARIAELREEQARSFSTPSANGNGVDTGAPKDIDTTPEGLIRELFVNMRRAQADGQIGAANKAIELIAELRGYRKNSAGDMLEKANEQKTAQDAPPPARINISDLKDAIGTISSEVDRLVKGDVQ